MIHRLTPLILVLAALSGAAWPTSRAWAGPNPDAKIILHLVPVESRRGTTCFSNLPKSVDEVVTAGKLAPQNYIAYVLITDFDQREGIAGVQFGISYDDSTGRGVDITSWQNCALYEWPVDDWPASGTGNLITWNQNDDCQTKSPISVGFFFLTAYTPDRLKLVPRPVDGLARVAICGVKAGQAGETSDDIKLENLGWADFGKGPGYNPWDPKQNLKKLPKFEPMKGRKGADEGNGN